jgi:hypothetical protein
VGFLDVILICAAVLVVTCGAAWLAFPIVKKRLKASIAYHVEEYVNRELGDITRELQRQALRDSAAFVAANFPHAETFTSRSDLLKHALDAVGADLRTGIYCEFGVYQALTLNFIASHVHEVHGFDSFEGLPEDWKPGMGKGHFKVDQIPDFAGNVVLHKGWFNETVPDFARDVSRPVAFMHVDCDLYSSTKTIFDHLGDLIVPGTVVVFDEYFNYPFWQSGEHQAFQELVDSHKISFDWLGYRPYGCQVAIRVTAAPMSRFRNRQTFDIDSASSLSK